MEGITFDNMSDTLLDKFPELKTSYAEERKFWDDEEPGPHIVYGDILMPFIRKLIDDGDEKKLQEVFNFLEKVSNNNDVKVQEVICVTVCEYLSGHDDLLSKTKKFMGPKTIQFAREINKFWWHENDI